MSTHGIESGALLPDGVWAPHMIHLNYGIGKFVLVGESSFRATLTRLRHGIGVENKASSDWVRSSQGADTPTTLAGVLTLSHVFPILAEKLVKWN